MWLTALSSLTHYRNSSQTYSVVKKTEIFAGVSCLNTLGKCLVFTAAEQFWVGRAVTYKPLGQWLNVIATGATSLPLTGSSEVAV